MTKLNNIYPNAIIILLVVVVTMIITTSAAPAVAATPTISVSDSECRKRITDYCGNEIRNNMLYGDDVKVHIYALLHGALGDG